MAEFRLKLSDGSTTIDLYSGSDAKIQNNGLLMPPPEVDAVYIGSPEYHGDRLARSRYRNRQIDIITKVWGSSLSDLQTNIRAIQRLLNDAQERELLGYGSQVYLEYQWGDTNDESVYFDILRGELVLPDDYFSQVLRSQYTVTDAVISLICKPFGRYTNQDISQATLENEDYSMNHNYQDIATDALHGDVPAKMYWKLDLTGATGSKKVWLAKRSGTRYDDDLWIQGEDESSTTTIITGSHSVVFTDESDAALSGSAYKRSELAASAENVSADSEITRLNYSIATPPRGHFRVLIYCRSTETSDNTEYAKMAWGYGWSYGDRTEAPSEAKDEYYSNSADNKWEILDLGDIIIPPISESDIAPNNSLELRIYQYAKEALTGNSIYTTPTGHDDPSSDWINESNAYDDDTGTTATSSTGSGWTGYIELTHSLITTAGIRYYHSRNQSDNIDIDAYYDGAWHDMYEGAAGNMNEWIYKYFTDGAHDVTKFRIRFNRTEATGYIYLKEVDFVEPNTEHRWDLDYIFLLPIDEGMVIIDDVAAADIIAMDSISDPPGIFIIDGSGNIVDTPDYVGKPFMLGRENTRLYVLRDDVKGVTFTSDVKYQPQFMVI